MSASPTPAQPLHTPIPLQERRALIAQILSGFCANPSIFAQRPDCGWSLCNCTDADLVGYAMHIADQVAEAAQDHLYAPSMPHAANEAKIAALVKALEPFAHPDLARTLAGNVEGDASPIFGRDRAILKLGDFKQARAALALART